ncbi:AAA family ATPase [Brevibacterium sp.]|uniref:ATP-binding protein n=1 Tax=Brevibacterium sp. TaxID=1701 RepID=UPI0028110A2B|nr:AAA family ATPase [Brevibacterium sp.]
MRLHSIRLQNYRGITDATVEFSSGVTVIEGPNEIGKSSIAQAIKHLREDKSSSKKQGIKDIQPVGSDVGPEVELHLTTGAYELKYRKRWLRQHTTELGILRPSPEQLAGDEAHDRFLSILAETVDVDLLVALDVAQGESLEQASLAQIKALHNALSESGAEVGDHDEFLERIEAEHSKYFTKSGKPTGEYREAIEALPEAEAEHQEMVDRSRGMDDLVENHARALAGLGSVRAQLAEATADLEEAEKAEAAVAELKDMFDTAAARAAAVERDLQIARDALARREKLASDFKESENSLLLAREALTSVEPDLTRYEAEFAAAQDELEAAQQRLDESREEEKRAGRRVARARARAQRTVLRDRLDEIRIHDEKRAQAQATIGSIAVTGTDVDHLRALETDLRIAENARTSAAAQVSVVRLGERAVLVDGAEIGTGAGTDFAVTKDVRIGVDGILDVTVRPGVSPRELDAAVEKARAALDAELDRLDVDSLAQARERAQERADAEAKLSETDATLKVLLGKDRRHDLEAALAKAEQLLGDGPAAPESDTVDVEELEAAQSSAAQRSEELQSAVESLRTHIEQKRSVRDRARVDLVRAQTTEQEAATQFERLQAAVAEARRAESDEVLSAAVEMLVSRSESVGEELAEARAAYEAADPESLAMQLENARQLVVRRERQREEDRQRVDQLAALIDDRASEGIYEKRAAAEQQLEHARSTLVRLERQATAIDLLRTTVLTRKNEAQRKYVAPFREQIERLGRLVFGPGFSVEVSEDLEIVSRTLNDRTVPFESLSGGTKEQLSLIGRLAVATLVDADTGAPVIVDDGCGFADQERLKALGVILNEVGRSAQVILLTCQPERFAGIGGAMSVSLGR